MKKDFSKNVTLWCSSIALAIVAFLSSPELSIAAQDCLGQQYLLLAKLVRLIDHHDARKALAIATQQIAKTPSDACAYAIRARLYCQIDENEAALNDASKALSFAPQHILALTTKAVCLVRLDRPKEALDYSNKAFRLLPVNGYVIDDRIEILITSRHIKEAKELLEKLLAQDPGDGVRRGRYIRVLVSEKNHEKVIEHTSIVLQQHPKFSNRYYILSLRADAYRKLGKLKLAERDYLEAQKQNAHCLETYRGLIEIYRATNNRAGLAKQEGFLKAMEEDF